MWIRRPGCSNFRLGGFRCSACFLFLIVSTSTSASVACFPVWRLAALGLKECKSVWLKNRRHGAYAVSGSFASATGLESVCIDCPAPFTCIDCTMGVCVSDLERETYNWPLINRILLSTFANMTLGVERMSSGPLTIYSDQYEDTERVALVRRIISTYLTLINGMVVAGRHGNMVRSVGLSCLEKWWFRIRCK